MSKAFKAHAVNPKKYNRHLKNVLVLISTKQKANQILWLSYLAVIVKGQELKKTVIHIY